MSAPPEASIKSPAIPDIRTAMVTYLKGRTNARENVHAVQPRRSTKRPFLLVIWDGDTQQADTRVPRARITIECFHQSPQQASYLARQVREVMVPPKNVTWGVHAVFTYEDEEGDTRQITLSGASLESGPREGPDERERIITTYLVDYY